MDSDERLRLAISVSVARAHSLGSTQESRRLVREQNHLQRIERGGGGGGACRCWCSGCCSTQDSRRLLREQNHLQRIERGGGGGGGSASADLEP